MNKKTTVKILRRTGIVLVTMPEPFTTPVGLACILAAQYLSNSLKKAHLNMIHKKKHNRFPEDFVYPHEVNLNNSYTHQRINFYSYDRSKRYRIPVQYKYNYTVKANPQPVPVLPEKSQPVEKYVTPNMERLARIKAEEHIKARTSTINTSHTEGKMIPHRVNLDLLAKRYQDIQSKSANFNASPATVNTEDAVPCSVNMKLLAQHKKMEKLENDKAVQAPKIEIKSRAVDVESLLKRFKKTQGSNTVTPQIRNSPSFVPSYRLAMGCC